MNTSLILLADAAAKQAPFDYKIAYIVCLVLGIVCFALAVTFFFVFNIPKVISFKTGTGAKQTVKRMKEINAQTGRLSNKDKYMISNGPKTEETLPPPGANASEINTPFKPANVVVSPSKNTETQQTEDNRGNNLTTVLGQNETTLLSSNNETTVLSSELVSEQASNEYKYVRETSGRFDIAFNLKLIHSDEII